MDLHKLSLTILLILVFLEYTKRVCDIILTVDTNLEELPMLKSNHVANLISFQIG